MDDEKLEQLFSENEGLDFPKKELNKALFTVIQNLKKSNLGSGE